MSAQDNPPPRLRELDFAPFADALAAFTPERDAAVGAIVTDATIPQVQAALAAGSLTSEELTLYFLSRIQKYDDQLRSFVELNPNALEEARAADATRAGGQEAGPLLGIPVSLKDNIETTTPMHTTGGSEILLDNVPAADAPLVQQLRAAGAVILGKNNLSEFAGGITGSIPGFSAVGGLTGNPHGEFTAGGSSSGSGSSTAAALTMVSVGSETSGSLIFPSSINGVVGMHPTNDLVNDEGVIPLISYSDTAGPIGRNVTDVATLLGVIDTADVDYAAALDANALNGVAVGVLRVEVLSPFNQASFEPVADNEAFLYTAAAGLTSAGATVSDVAMVSPEDLPFPTLFSAVIPADATDELRQQLEAAVYPSMRLSFSYTASGINYGVAYDMLPYITAAGAQVSTVAELQAYNNENPQRRIPAGQVSLDGAVTTLGAPDALNADQYAAFMATGAQAASAILDAAFEQNGVEVLVSLTNLHSGIYALAGYPAITIPLGLHSNGAPTGVTLIGKKGQDAQLLAYAYAFEQATHLRVTPNLDAE